MMVVITVLMKSFSITSLTMLLFGLLFTVSYQKSGLLPGVGLMHALFALFPTKFPETKWNQASDLAPLFNELVDHVCLDGQFFQESLSSEKRNIKWTV